MSNFPVQMDFLNALNRFKEHIAASGFQIIELRLARLERGMQPPLQMKLAVEDTVPLQELHHSAAAIPAQPHLALSPQHTVSPTEDVASPAHRAAVDEAIGPPNRSGALDALHAAALQIAQSRDLSPGLTRSSFSSSPPRSLPRSPARSLPRSPPRSPLRSPPRSVHAPLSVGMPVLQPLPSPAMSSSPRPVLRSRPHPSRELPVVQPLPSPAVSSFPTPPPERPMPVARDSGICKPGGTAATVTCSTVRSGARGPLVCPQCPQSFRYKSKLQRHVNFVHDGKRGRDCRECDKSFFYNADLEKHYQLVHRKERPWRCSVQACPAKFQVKGQLRRHMSVSHPQFSL